MFLDLSNCGPSAILKVLYFIKTLIDIVLFFVPIGLIIFLSIDFGKAMISGDESTQKKVVQLAIKRILYTIVLFLVPVFVSFTNSMLGNAGVNYSVCWENLNLEEIKYLSTVEYSCEIAERYVAIAEYKLTDSAIEKASEYVDEAMDEEIKIKLQKRLEIAKEEAKNKANKENSSNFKELTFQNLSTGGESCVVSGIKVLTSEPNPSCAINYWHNYIDKNNFIYPEKNGKKLGAWPKNYNTIPTKLSSPKTYQNGKLIWPVTPNGNKYKFGYEHNGIDISARMGEPIYSPVSGKISYSEWGHTCNKGSDETAYTISIIMDEPLIVSGVSYNTIFLTHLSGIVERCGAGSCNVKVEKGELIGFVGTAAGEADTGGYAPHLHMTIHPATSYSDGLMTSDIQKLYNMTCGSGCKNLDMKAGG